MPSHVLRKILPVAITFLLIAGWSRPELRAEELVLSNGDHLTGQLVKRADGKIYFLSPVLGQIVVPDTQATIAESPSVESLVGLPPAQTSAAKPAPVAATARQPAPKLIAPPQTTPWKGSLEFGYTQLSGRTNALSTSVRASTEKTAGPDNFKLSGSYLYGESQGSPNIDRTDANFRWRHDLSKRTFVQFLSTYYNDKIKQISSDVEQNAGFGYKLIDSGRQTSNIGAGLTAQYRHALGLQPGVIYLGEFFQDYSYKLNGRLSILEDSGLLYSPTDRSIAASVVNGQNIATREAANFKYHFGSTLQGKMTDHISLNLRYEYEYDNVVLDPGARGDHRVTSSIAYGF